MTVINGIGRGVEAGSPGLVGDAHRGWGRTPSYWAGGLAGGYCPGWAGGFGTTSVAGTGTVFRGRPESNP